MIEIEYVLYCETDGEVLRGLDAIIRAARRSTNVFCFQSGHTTLRMSFLSFFVFTFYSTESDETLTDFLRFIVK